MPGCQSFLSSSVIKLTLTRTFQVYSLSLSPHLPNHVTTRAYARETSHQPPRLRQPILQVRFRRSAAATPCATPDLNAAAGIDGMERHPRRVNHPANAKKLPYARSVKKFTYSGTALAASGLPVQRVFPCGPRKPRVRSLPLLRPLGPTGSATIPHRHSHPTIPSRWNSCN